MENVRERLATAEDKVRELREQKAQTVKIRDAALASAQHHDDDESYEAAKVAVEAVKAVEEKLEKVSDDQLGLLKKLGDSQAGLSGFALPGVANGWHEAARTLSLASGDLRADVPAQTLLRPSGTPALTPAQTTPTTPGPVSNRWVYPIFDTAPFGDREGDLAAT